MRNGANYMRVKKWRGLKMGISAELEARTGGAAGAKRDACAICGRTIGANEVKFVLASKAFGQGRIEISKRMACVSCYTTMAPKSRVRSRAVHRQGVVSRIISKRIAQSMMQAR